MRINKPYTILILLLAVANLSYAQQVKPQFKELTVVSYQPNDSLKKMGVTIGSYCHVNSDGILHVILNDGSIFFKDKSPRLSFTGFVRDTTYQLSDDAITALNTVFNGKRKLKSYIILSNLPHGIFVSPPGSFMTYTTNDNVKDQLIFDQDFFGREMNLPLNKLFFSKRARQKKPSGIYHYKALEAEIIKYHKACLCIPQTKAPPTVKELPTPVSH